MPHEAAVVVRAFEHVAAGGSLRSLALALEAEGVDPAPGREWSPRRLRDILTNTHYAGYPTHRGIPSAVKSSSIVPIVDEVLAAEVRAILKDEARRTSPGPTPRHLGSGIARCGAGDCDAFLMNLAGAYRCKSSSAHPCISKDRLDACLRREVARAFLAAGDDLLAGQVSEAVAPLMDALARNEAAATVTAANRDEGLLSPVSAKARLITLRDERLALEARIEAVRVERSSSSVLAEVAREVLEAAPLSVTMGEFDRMLEAVVEAFATLDIDRQRDVTRALLDVTVYAGRAPRRVVVEHKMARFLNPHEQAIDVDPGEGRSRGRSCAPANRREPRASPVSA